MPKNKQLLVKGISYLITMDDQRQIITDAALVVEGNTIVKVGKQNQLEKGQYDSVIDAKGKICLPGLINAHFHAMQQLARGVADNVFSPTWLHDRIWPFEAEMTAEDVYWSYMMGSLDLIKNGITCFGDPGGYHSDEAVKAIKDIGVRANICRSILDIHTRVRPIPDSLRETTEETVGKGEEFVKKYNGYADGRIKGSFSLRGDRSVSNKCCEMVRDLAEKYQVGIHAHLSSHTDGVNRHKELFDGQRPIERYAKLGLINQYLIAIHMNDITNEEVELVLANHTKIIHCPTAGYAGAYGTLWGKHSELVRKGATVALGSDGPAVSNYCDMFRVMSSLGGHRDFHIDPTLFTPEKSLEMCLVNGAKVLFWEKEIGSIEPGKQADFILVDCNHPDFVPFHNVLSNLVYAANGHCVDSVVINGKLVMEGRKLLTFDENEIMEKALAAGRRLLKASGLETIVKPKWPIR